MAGEKVNIDILLNTAQSAKNIRELRQVMKELSFAQEEVDKSSPDFGKLAEGINEVEGRIGDLGDAMKTMTGSSVERLTGATNLLGESFNNLDLDKFKIALQGLKQLPKALAGEINELSETLSYANLNFKSMKGGMKALGESGVGQLTKSIIQLGKAILTNPLLLLAAVLVGIIAVCVKFADKIKPIRIAMDAVGKAIDFVVQKLKDFADWLGITDFAGEKSAEKQLDNYKKVQDGVEKRYDGEIRLAAAAGKDTYELEKKKLKAVQVSVEKQIEALNKLRAINGKLTKEQKDQLKELKDALQTNVIDIKELDIKKTKEKADADKKAAEDTKKKSDDAAKTAAANTKERIAANKAATDKIKDQNIDLIDDERKREEEKLKLENQRAIESIKNSKASADVKAQALLTQKQTFDKKMLELGDKYNTEDKAKALEAAVIKANLAEQLDTENVDKKIALLDVQKEYDLLSAKDDANKKLKIEADYQVALAAIKKGVTDKDINDTLQANLLKAQINLNNNENSFAAQKAVLDAQYAIDLDGAKGNAIQKAQVEADYINKVAALEKKRRKEIQDNVINTGQNAIDGLSTMSQNYYDSELARAGNNQKARNVILKKQFNMEKAFNLARATIDGVRSVMSAMDLPPPASFIMAGINAAMAATNIAKISSQQFTPEGGTSGGSAPIPSVPSPSSGAMASNFSAPQFYGLGQTQTMNSVQQNKVVVVETDITKTQQKVSAIQAKATQSL